MDETVRRFAVAEEVRGIDEAARTITAWVSRESIDRYETVFIAAGMDLERFRRNPVVLWDHCDGMPPIGRCVDIRPVPGEGVEATTEFAAAAANPMAEQVWQLYRGGFLRAWSVRCLLTAPPTMAEAAGADNAPVIFPSTELLEYSAVAVPGNADCLVRAAREGLDLAAPLLRLYFPDQPEATGEARWHADLKRAGGALEGCANWLRHLAREGGVDEAQTHALQPLLERLRELGDLAGLTAPAATPDLSEVTRRLEAIEAGLSALQATGLPLTPAAETHPPTLSGDPSADVMQALPAVVTLLREIVQSQPTADELADQVLTRLRRASVGGRL